MLSERVVWGKTEETEQADQKNGAAESKRIVFPAVFRVSSTHGAQPTVIGTQTVDEH